MLSKEEVRHVKHLLEEGMSHRDIANLVGVGKSTIGDIARGKTHSEVGARTVLDTAAEIAALRNENSALKHELREAVKEHGLFLAIQDVIEDSITPFTPPKSVWKPETKKRKITEHLVMHMSDGHHDQVVLPTDCGGLEEYNFDISCRRAEVYVDTVLKWSQETLSGDFTFPHLTVLVYGDMTSGEIHKAVQRSKFQNSFKNAIAIGKLHSSMLYDLAPHFEKVNVVYVPGNHGRRSPKKDYIAPTDNWDYLIAKVAELQCQNLTNVEFLIPESFSVNLSIEGHGFYVFHGDDIRSWNGVPWYGLQRRQSNILSMGPRVSDIPIKYLCCGHFHRRGGIASMDGEMLINGAWLATDAYCYNSLGVYTEPSQLLHGVHPDHGITWRLPVSLRRDGEKRGPKRYRIEV